MPVYAYTCQDCGHHLEQHQAFTDPPLTQCPHCQGRLRKLFNSVGVVFKGSGFYRTDSRAESRSRAKTAAKTKETKTSAADGATAATPASSSSPKAESSSDKSGPTASGSASGSAKSNPAKTSAAAG